MQLSKIFTVLALAVSGIQGAPSEGLYVKVRTPEGESFLAERDLASLPSNALIEARDGTFVDKREPDMDMIKYRCPCCKKRDPSDCGYNYIKV